MPQEEILDAVQSELNAGSNAIGYRAMHQRLQQNGVCATREEVRHVYEVSVEHSHGTINVELS